MNTFLDGRLANQPTKSDEKMFLLLLLLLSFVISVCEMPCKEPLFEILSRRHQVPSLSSSLKFACSISGSLNQKPTPAKRRRRERTKATLKGEPSVCSPLLLYNFEKPRQRADRRTMCTCTCTHNTRERKRGEVLVKAVEVRR